MADDTKPRWQILCEQIQSEQDPKRFTELVEELVEVLREKELREEKLSQRRAA